MSSAFRLRLALDFLAVVLMIACLAYWWLDNLWHELFGTALFALVIVHNVFNRRFYGTVTKGRRSFQRLFNIATIICLAVGMIIMLVTSLIISRDVFSFMSLGGAFAIREIHMFAGYWVLLIIAIHLGTRWAVVMNLFRAATGITKPSFIRATALRLVALALFAWGINSSFEMGYGAKLMLTYSLDMWDFSESTLGFFLNYGSIVAMFAVATHYGLVLQRAVFQRTSGSAEKPARQ